MSIEAMKQALEALEFAAGLISPITKGCQCQICLAHDALRQAIEQVEKQEPVAWMWNDGTLTADPDYADGTWTPLYAAPVHANDISQERVDETSKRKDEPVVWHEPGAYGNVTTHKDWALANGWEPLYKERT